MLPKESKARKAVPITTGVLDYFPDAIAEVARVSKRGNDQHNPGEPLHWAREKSTDHADCVGRHLLERGTLDDDGMRHSAKLAWRALALLQVELEAEGIKTAETVEPVKEQIFFIRDKKTGVVRRVYVAHGEVISMNKDEEVVSGGSGNESIQGVA